MFKTPGQKGKILIQGAIESFNVIIRDLKEGIDHCNDQIDYHTVQMDQHNEKIMDLNQDVSLAKRMASKIEDIIK